MSRDATKKEDILGIEIGYFIHSALKELKRTWWLLLVLVLVFSLATELIWRNTYTPVYKAYCSFTVKVVNKSTTGGINSLYGFYYDKDLAAQLEKTFTYILTSDLLNDEVQEYLGDHVRNGNIEAECIEGSNMFVLSTYSTTPEDAGALLDAVLSCYEDAARYVVGELEVELVEQPVRSSKPVNEPSLLLEALIGVILGAVCWLIYAVARMIRNRTVLKPEDLEEQLNMPCLGLVPQVDAKHQSRGGSGLSISNSHMEGEFRESIRGIARKVESAMERKGAKVLLITSTLPSEGKTVLCRNLAQVFAEWGKRVTLLDCDMRKPALYRRFGLKDQQLPLEAVINGEVPLDQLVCYPEKRNLRLVANSQPVEEPTVLIDSPAMEQFIGELKRNTDYLIMDTPPCDTVSDVSLLMQYADYVLYVVRQDYGSLSQIVTTVENIFEDESKLMGYILNDTAKTAHGYGKYGYGAYSYGKYGNGYYGKYGHYGKSSYHGFYSEDEYNGPSEK